MTSITPSKIKPALTKVLANFDARKSVGNPYMLYGKLVGEFGETDQSVLKLIQTDEYKTAGCMYKTSKGELIGARLIVDKNNVAELEIVIEDTRFVVSRYDSNEIDLIAKKAEAIG